MTPARLLRARPLTSGPSAAAVCFFSNSPRLRAPTSRFYHAPSPAFSSPSSSSSSQRYSPSETAILTAALGHVSRLGFTSDALARGAEDAGFLPASANLFPHGPFELVMFHLVTQRLALKDVVQFPDHLHQGSRGPGVAAKVRTLLLSRLRANAAIQPRLAEALATMSLAGNIPASLAELARLVDEIWYLAGDTSVDASWYSKRAALAGVYASSELFMSQDTSPDLSDTAAFVDRRLSDVTRVGSAARDVGEWVGFTGLAAVNVIRSWGAKI